MNRFVIKRTADPGSFRLTREAWKQFIVEKKPEYFVTVTFCMRLPDRAATSTLNFFFRCVYKSLPKQKRYNAHGFVCVERTSGGAFAGFNHFHILFCQVGGSPEDERRFRSIVTRATRRLKSNRRVPLVPVKNFHFAAVYDAKRLSAYVTKKGELPYDKDGLRIWMFDSSGVHHDLTG